ncbi:MAG: M20/M25/M40 family metallo-hydrolase [Sphingomonadaceae bacterium]
MTPAPSALFARCFLLAPLLLLAALAAPAVSASPEIGEEGMMEHIEILASDAYEGRKPGTAGETRTLDYIAWQFARLGLLPAGAEGWFHPVPLVERRPFAKRALFTDEEGGWIALDEELLLTGPAPQVSIADAPLVFVGHGLVMPEAGIDQLEGAALDGAVALMLFGDPEGIEGAPGQSAKVETLAARGARAVITVVPPSIAWNAVAAQLGGGRAELESEASRIVSGAMSAAAAEKLLGADPFAAGPGFVARTLDRRATLDVSTLIRSYVSRNILARLPGSGAMGEKVLILGHWDHLGICRPEGAEDRICNGAVDNASGIALILEAAEALARGPRPERDILFLGTTAEEMGLLGAKAFVESPPFPLEQLVGAVNVDTVAIARAGTPVGIVGRGMTAIDPLIDEIAVELGREIGDGDLPNQFYHRQDGIVFNRAGVPTVMVTSAFAEEDQLNAYLSGPYHQPSDEIEGIELGGAVEDARFIVALVRAMADPERFAHEGR